MDVWELATMTIMSKLGCDIIVFAARSPLDRETRFGHD